MSKQRDEDFWEPVPSALAKRIDAAIGSWDARRRDLYRQISVARIPKRSDEKKFWELISEQIAEMEDCFASILEQIPPASHPAVKPKYLLPTDADDSLVTMLVIQARQGLAFTASCRSEIGDGRAAAAALSMHIATECYLLIRMTLYNEVTAPLIETGISMQAKRAAGLETIGKNRRRETEDRVAYYRLLRAQVVKKEQIPKEAARKWGVTRKHARKWLNENTGFATDS